MNIKNSMPTFKHDSFLVKIRAVVYYIPLLMANTFTTSPRGLFNGKHFKEAAWMAKDAAGESGNICWLFWSIVGGAIVNPLAVCLIVLDAVLWILWRAFFELFMLLLSGVGMLIEAVDALFLKKKEKNEKQEESTRVRMIREFIRGRYHRREGISGAFRYFDTVCEVVTFYANGGRLVAQSNSLEEMYRSYNYDYNQAILTIGHAFGIFGIKNGGRINSYNHLRAGHPEVVQALVQAARAARDQFCNKHKIRYILYLAKKSACPRIIIERPPEGSAA